jgi:hypothetical protein
MTVAETKEVGQYKIEIHYDECAESPREWDNLGTMACFHGRYNLGDKHNLSIEEVKEIAEAQDNVCLNLYLYDHGGITMNCSGFSCPWDSGQVGIIFVSFDKIKKEYGDTSPETLEKVRGYLKGEVETYDAFIRGEVYGFKIFKVTTCDKCNESHEEDLDSCWGFIGDSDDCMKEAESIVNHMISKGE